MTALSESNIREIYPIKSMHFLLSTFEASTKISDSSYEKEIKALFYHCIFCNISSYLNPSINKVVTTLCVFQMISLILIQPIEPALLDEAL